MLLLLISIGNSGAEEVLNWQDCIKEAAKNNPDLIAAVEEIKQSQAGKQITASALWPQINSNLNASTSRSDNNLSSSVGDSYSYGLSGTQLIFDGNKTVNNVRAAGETIKASQQSFYFTSATVRFRLRSAFVDLLKTQEMLRITQEIFAIRRQNLELITLRYESGLEHKGAYLTADADLAQAKYQISQAKRNVEVARQSLVKEMGRQELSALEVKGDFLITDAAKEKPDFVKFAQDHPSLKQLVAQVNSAEFSLRSAYANFAPALNGSAGANKNGKTWEPRGNQWNLGLVLSMPLFEGGLRMAQVSQAKALLNQLKENQRSTRDGLVLTLEKTWAILQDTIDYVEVQRKSLIATEERSKIAQAQYSIGFIAFDNWTIIEDNLVQAKTAYLNAQASALLAEANWIQAKGETIENG
ncbi:MAG: TolC family protein [Candidatus Omnitrophota bacterium]